MCLSDFLPLGKYVRLVRLTCLVSVCPSVLTLETVSDLSFQLDVGPVELLLFPFLLLPHPPAVLHQAPPPQTDLEVVRLVQGEGQHVEGRPCQGRGKGVG